MSKAPQFILRSTREGGPSYYILAYDPETKMGRLRNVAGGVEFRESLDKPRLKQYGYRIEPIPQENDHAEQQGVQA